MNNVITNANGVKVKVRVYDIGDGEIDRYAIICVSDKGKDSSGVGILSCVCMQRKSISSTRNRNICW